MNCIKGVVISKGDKWYKVNLANKSGENYLLINSITSKLRVGDYFVLCTETSKKQYGKLTKWFHIPKIYKKRVTMGFGLDTFALQPIIGNIFVYGGRVYMVKKCLKRDNGISYGYDTDYWWELSCDDITDTEFGISIMDELIKGE